MASLPCGPGLVSCHRGPVCCLPTVRMSIFGKSTSPSPQGHLEVEAGNFWSILGLEMWAKGWVSPLRGSETSLGHPGAGSSLGMGRPAWSCGGAEDESNRVSLRPAPGTPPWTRPRPLRPAPGTSPRPRPGFLHGRAQDSSAPHPGPLHRCALDCAWALRVSLGCRPRWQPPCVP